MQHLRRDESHRRAESRKPTHPFRAPRVVRNRPPVASARNGRPVANSIARDEDRDEDSMGGKAMFEGWRHALRAGTGALGRMMLVAALAGGLAAGPAHASPAAESHYASVLLDTVQSIERLDELVVDILAMNLDREKHAIARRM